MDTTRYEAEDMLRRFVEAHRPSIVFSEWGEDAFLSEVDLNPHDSDVREIVGLIEAGMRSRARA